MAFKPQKISSVNDLFIKDVKKELRLQGHYDTGNLEASFLNYNQAVNNEIILQVYAAGYITDLEEGVPADKIKISDADFEKLRGWVKRKVGVLSSAEATAVAAAIVRKWKKSGKPLPGAAEYSKTGKTTGAVSDSVKKNEEKYVQRLDKVIEDEIDSEFLKTKSGTI